MRLGIMSVSLCLLLVLCAGYGPGVVSSSDLNTNLNAAGLLQTLTNSFNDSTFIDADDRDGDGITDCIEDELVQRFAPVVRLHPDDIYQPANVSWYLARVRMCFDHKWWFDDPLLNHGAVTLQNLLTQSCHDQCCGLAPGGTGFFLEHTDIDGGDSLDVYRNVTRQGTDPSGWTCYAHVRRASEDHQGMYDIHYIFFYAYNGDIAWGPIESGHEADWEHVTVRVGDDLRTIHGIHYPAHSGEGRWYEEETFPGARDGYAVTADGRPVVYSAFNSHASYPWAGKWQRNWNFDDITQDNGPEWDCRLNIKNVGEIERPREGMEWIQYSGFWGEIGEVGWATSPCGPAYQEWWKGDPPEGFVRSTSSISLNSGGLITVFALGMISIGGLFWIAYRLLRRR